MHRVPSRLLSGAASGGFGVTFLVAGPWPRCPWFALVFNWEYWIIDYVGVTVGSVVCVSILVLAFT